MNRKTLTAALAKIIFVGLFATAAQAQNIEDQLPDGAIMPGNLSDLGGQMRDRVGTIVFGDENLDVNTGEGVGRRLDLFSGAADEDENILEIKRIARELEIQRGFMLQIADLQSSLIAFALADPVAAYKSRIPTHVCEYALEDRFCDQMSSSFQKRDEIIRETIIIDASE